VARQGLAVIDFKLKRFTRMRTKNAALFALGLLPVNFWLNDSARCQTSLTPPLSLAQPATSPNEGSQPSATTAKRSAPPVTARAVPSPKPAADYDGLSPLVEDKPLPTMPLRSRTTNQPKLTQEPSIAEQRAADQREDEKLKHKLTICRDCK
jgi:hypothetical protein